MTTETDARVSIAAAVAAVPADVRAKAREMCADVTGLDPDQETEGGYGPGWSEDGNHTTNYAAPEPMWLAWVDDAERALG